MHHALTAEQVAGSKPLPATIKPGAAIENSFRGRLEELDEATRRALVVAAAAEDVEMSVLVPALEAGGSSQADLEAAEAAGVISTEAGRMVFSHPLIRAVAYHAGSPPERRAAHLLVAGAVPEGDLGRRAWHLAEASLGPDERVASALIEAADSSRARGALASAGELGARAAALSTTPDSQVQRTLLAALDLGRSGDPIRALDLLDAVGAAADDPALNDTVKRVRALLLVRFGQLDLSIQLLLEVAESRAETDPSTAARALIEASLRDRVVGDFSGMHERSELARALAREADPPDPDTIALTEVHGAFADTVVGKEGTDPAGDLKRNEGYLLAGDPLVAPEVLSGALHTGVWLEQFDWASRMLTLVIDEARGRSAVTELAYPLAAACQLEMRRGNLGLARANGDEAVRFAADTSQTLLEAFALGLLAEAEAALGHEDALRHGEESLAFLDSVGATMISAWPRPRSASSTWFEGSRKPRSWS